MKKKWLLLLMTPLFTYANHQYNDLDDDHFYSHGFVFESQNAYYDNYIESELPYFEDYAELFVEAFQEEERRDEEHFVFRETIRDDEEVVAAPVAAKRGDQKRPAAKTAQPASKSRSKDLREQSSRPRVTHRDKTDGKLPQEPAQAAPKHRPNDQFVFQEEEFENSALNPQSIDVNPSASKENKAYSEPAREQKKAEVSKKQESARKNSVQSAKQSKGPSQPSSQKHQPAVQVQKAQQGASAKSADPIRDQKRPRKVSLRKSVESMQAGRSQSKVLKQNVSRTAASQKTAQAESAIQEKNGELGTQEQIQKKRGSSPPASTAKQQRRKATVKSDQAELQYRAKSYRTGKRPIEE